MLVTSAVLNEIKSLYPYLDLKPLSRQQETLIQMLLQGSSLSAAARGAGYASNENARHFLETEPAQRIMQYFHEQQLDTISINRTRLTQMYLELYGERGNTNEGARVLEGLARLHGLNEEARQKKTEVNVTNNTQNNTIINGELDQETVRKKMEVMDEQQLLQQAGPRFEGLTLEPEPVVIEQESSDVRDDDDPHQ